MYFPQENLSADDAVKWLNQRCAFVLNGSQGVILWEGETPSRFIDVKSMQQLMLPFRIKPNKAHKTTSAFSTWLASAERRTYTNIGIYPTDTTCPENTLNLWKGFAVSAKKGDWSLFNQHLREVVCNQNKEHYTWLICWIADIMQNPSTPQGTAVVLTGGQGTGKSIVAQVVGKLLGQHFLQLNGFSRLLAQFNDHTSEAILIGIDEAFMHNRKSWAAQLKALITEPTRMIEAKGLKATTIPNRTRYIMTSNEAHVLDVDADSRRYAVFEVSNQYRSNKDYFDAMMQQMENGGYEAMLHDLLNVNTAEVNLRIAPETDALTAHKLSSMSSLQKWLYERLMLGQISPFDKWPSIINCADMVNDYPAFLKERLISNRSVQTEVGMFLRRVFPSLAKIRKSNGGKQEWCYMLPSLENARIEFGMHMNMQISWPPLDEPCHLHEQLNALLSEQ